MAKPYTNAYKEKAFYFWYENDRPSSTRMSLLLTDIRDEEGKSPSAQLIVSWRAELGWEERADALDAQLSISMDTQVIDKRIQMFKEHAEVGKMIVQKGKEYFDTHPVDDANVAIRAITSGVEIQRISVGQAEAWAKVATMTDSQIMAELKKLTGKAPTPENEFTMESEPESSPVVDAEIDEIEGDDE